MGIREAFAKAALAAYNAAGDTKESVILRSKDSRNPSYNTSTGAVTDSYVDYPVEMLITGFNENEKNNSAIVPGMVKAQIPPSMLKVAPKINDQVIRKTDDPAMEDTEVWEIVYKHKDPAHALWTFHLKRP